MDSEDVSIPADFPRGDSQGAVGGVQPKLVGRMIDGRFVAGWTEQERHARFDVCADLVNQLELYCRRKLAEVSGTDTATLLPKVKRAIQGKGWDVTEPELDWILRAVSARFEGPVTDGAHR